LSKLKQLVTFCLKIRRKSISSKHERIMHKCFSHTRIVLPPNLVYKYSQILKNLRNPFWDGGSTCYAPTGI
jgi:hypothetical protein